MEHKNTYGNRRSLSNQYVIRLWFHSKQYDEGCMGKVREIKIEATGVVG
jgi:hypothetical protein